MSNSLPASVRRQIIEFDPGLADSVSISQFCKQLGISRPSYYKVKKRFVQEGNRALNPHSRAPKTPARTFDDATRTARVADPDSAGQGRVGQRPDLDLVRRSRLR